MQLPTLPEQSEPSAGVISPAQNLESAKRKVKESSNAGSESLQNIN